MSLELDKRIKSMQNIETVFSGCKDWLFMGKMGYFADNLEEFRDLTKCVYGEYMGYAEKDQCFTAEVRGNATQFVFRYFIPEDVLIPEEPEKKYRPYSLEEFFKIFKVGDLIHFRRKNDDEVKVAMFTGYITDVDRIDDKTPGAVELMLGIFHYSLFSLFDEGFEVFFENKWQPFGVIDEDKE